MATRIEKEYRTNSINCLNDILNYCSEYLASKTKMSKKETDFFQKVIKQISYFFQQNNVSDDDIKRAVNKMK